MRFFHFLDELITQRSELTTTTATFHLTNSPSKDRPQASDFDLPSYWTTNLESKGTYSTKDLESTGIYYDTELITHQPPNTGSSLNLDSDLISSYYPSEPIPDQPPLTPRYDTELITHHPPNTGSSLNSDSDLISSYYPSERIPDQPPLTPRTLPDLSYALDSTTQFTTSPRRSGSETNIPEIENDLEFRLEGQIVSKTEEKDIWHESKMAIILGLVSSCFSLIIIVVGCLVWRYKFYLRRGERIRRHEAKKEMKRIKRLEKEAKKRRKRRGEDIGEDRNLMEMSVMNETNKSSMESQNDSRQAINSPPVIISIVNENYSGV